MKKLILSILFASTMLLQLQAQDTIPLYPDGKIPNSKPVENTEKSEKAPGGILVISNVTQPTLTAYLPPADKANGTDVIICPGGGYRVLAADHEGEQIARVLTQ